MEAGIPDLNHAYTQCPIRLYRNGTLLKTIQANILSGALLDGSGNTYYLVTNIANFVFTDAPGNGTFTYTIVASQTGGVATITNGGLQLIVLRR
jgi:hypothetical protein